MKNPTYIHTQIGHTCRQNYIRKHICRHIHHVCVDVCVPDIHCCVIGISRIRHMKHVYRKLKSHRERRAMWIIIKKKRNIIIITRKSVWRKVEVTIKKRTTTIAKHILRIFFIFQLKVYQFTFVLCVYACMQNTKKVNRKFVMDI